MTTKEIAVALGKPEKTVRTWASKASAESAVATAKLAEATPSNPVDWDLEETISIIEVGMGKNAADLYRMNAQQKAPQTDITVMVSSIVAETIKQLMPYLIQHQPAKQSQAQISAPLPVLSARKELTMLAREAGYIMGDYREPYNQIYKNAYYRLGINLRERAKNRGLEVLDYAETEGYMPQLVAIAREIFK